MKYVRFKKTVLLCLATLLLSSCLKSSAWALEGIKAAQSSLYVKPVEGLKDDFIRGVDVSSYLAEKESGVVYRDFAGKELDDDGFFKLLADSGVNWVRLRVWNNPADSDGNSYGGGHNDLDTAISIGKLATKAGLKVCIDFHYSDFWADPNKQAVPKEWAHMTLENKTKALAAFTADSLTRLLDSGVDVQMVQIGNEINNGLAGETEEKSIYQLLKAGSTAVRTVSSQERKPVQIAVHYTNPEGPNFMATVGSLWTPGSISMCLRFLIIHTGMTQCPS